MDHVLGLADGLLSFIPGVGHAAPPVVERLCRDRLCLCRRPRRPGAIESIAVSEGDRVAAGDVLFVLEASQQQAQYDAALARAKPQAQVEARRADLANLKTGAAAEEIAGDRSASLMQAEADLALAQQNFTRSAGAVRARADRPSRSSTRRRRPRMPPMPAVVQLKAQLGGGASCRRATTGRSEIAAEATLASPPTADAANAKAMLDNRTIVAPDAGRIERLFFSCGRSGRGGRAGGVARAATARSRSNSISARRTGRSSPSAEHVAVSCDGCADGAHGDDRSSSRPTRNSPRRSSIRATSGTGWCSSTEAVMDEENGVLPGQPVSIGRIE